MGVFAKIRDFLARRAAAEKRELRRQRDLAVNGRDPWQEVADGMACETLRIERDKARAQIVFLQCALSTAKAETKSARDGRENAERDALKYLDGLAALEAELIDNHGWTQERCDEFTGLGEKAEPMTKQDIAEDVGHDRYRGLVEDR